MLDSAPGTTVSAAGSQAAPFSGQGPHSWTIYLWTFFMEERTSELVSSLLSSIDKVVDSFQPYLVSS